MKHKITCAIASSLDIPLPRVHNLSFEPIESNTEFKPDSYSILLLDKSRYTLYTEKRFTSEKYFDAIAYYDKETNKADDVIEVCSVFDDILSHPGILAHQ